MKKIHADLIVNSVSRINREHILLTVAAENSLPVILPGQFAEIRMDLSKNTFLRRPFSVHSVDFTRNTVDFLIKEVGEGSRSLSGVVPGMRVNIVFPLGKGFTIPPDGKPLLIGGGCGVAPLLFLAQFLHRRGFHPDILIGGRSCEDVLEADRYRSYGDVFITTEDGSCGTKGFVTNHEVITNNLHTYSMLYACGPEPMMKAVADIAYRHSIPCEVSLENTMACGIGACLCCVTETTEGNQCVCTEGPVFNINRLKWHH